MTKIELTVARWASTSSWRHSNWSFSFNLERIFQELKPWWFSMFGLAPNFNKWRIHLKRKIFSSWKFVLRSNWLDMTVGQRKVKRCVSVGWLTIRIRFLFQTLEKLGWKSMHRIIRRKVLFSSYRNLRFQQLSIKRFQIDWKTNDYSTLGWKWCEFRLLKRKTEIFISIRKILLQNLSSGFSNWISTLRFGFRDFDSSEMKKQSTATLKS